MRRPLEDRPRASSSGFEVHRPAASPETTRITKTQSGCAMPRVADDRGTTLTSYLERTLKAHQPLTGCQLPRVFRPALAAAFASHTHWRS